MIAHADIQAFADKVGELFKPEKVILFGSQTRGTSDRGSDVDIMVLLDHEGRNRQKAVEMLNATHPHFPIDLLVRKPLEFRERIALGDFFLMEIEETGKVLYESAR